MDRSDYYTVQLLDFLPNLPLTRTPQNVDSEGLRWPARDAKRDVHFSYDRPFWPSTCHFWWCNFLENSKYERQNENPCSGKCATCNWFFAREKSSNGEYRKSWYCWWKSSNHPWSYLDYHSKISGKLSIFDIFLTYFYIFFFDIFGVFWPENDPILFRSNRGKKIPSDIMMMTSIYNI